MGKRPSLPLAAALAVALLTGAAWPQPLEPEPTRRSASPLLIVALPQMSWRDLRSADMPFANDLLPRAASGLMPIASPADPDPDRTWVTLGAGTAAAGGDLRGSALEQAGFLVDVSALRAGNDRAHTGARPGWLGSRLRESGLTTAVIAYRTSARTVAPPSVTVLMDENGRVDGGGLYDSADPSPLGKRLDHGQVRASLQDAASRFDAVLLDLSGSPVGPQLDGVIAEAAQVARAGRAALVLLCALSPAHAEDGTRTMGFVVWLDFSADESSTARLLTSPSTRWQGLVAAADFAPTVLAWWAGRPPARAAVTGRAMRMVESKDGLHELDRLDLMLSERDRLRKTAAFVWGISLLALTGAAFLLTLAGRKALAWLAVPALAAALFPVGLLLAPLAGMGQARQLLAAAGLAAGGALLGARLSRVSLSLGVPMVLGASVIALDVVLGSPLMRRSPLGFSVLSGLRFYGIGNEYAGVLGAMVTMGLGTLLGQRRRRAWLTTAVSAMVLLVVGAPWWGANWGGYVAVAAGLIALWVGGSQRRGRAVALGAVALILMAPLPAVLDLLGASGDRSHIGAAAGALLSGQFGVLGDMVPRKILMNWRIAVQAGWWWAAGFVPLLAAHAMLRRGRPARVLLSREPSLAVGLVAAVVTAGVAVVVNDSGVVALATALSVVSAALVFAAARAGMDVR